MFTDLAAILKESERLKAENRKLRAFARAAAKECGCDGTEGCRACLARDLLARLEKGRAGAA